MDMKEDNKIIKIRGHLLLTSDKFYTSMKLVSLHNTICTR